MLEGSAAEAEPVNKSQRKCKIQPKSNPRQHKSNRNQANSSRNQIQINSNPNKILANESQKPNPETKPKPALTYQAKSSRNPKNYNV